MTPLHHSRKTIDELDVRPETCEEQPHRCFFLNGQRLDMLLAQMSGHSRVEGLVPTLLPWSPFPEERDISWSRILPENGVQLVAPLLMCPSDMDFECELVVVELISLKDTITWLRFGWNRSAVFDDSGYARGLVGQKVEWFDGLRAFVFDKTCYRREVLKFSAEEEMWEPSPKCTAFNLLG